MENIDLAGTERLVVESVQELHGISAHKTLTRFKIESRESSYGLLKAKTILIKDLRQSRTIILLRSDYLII